MLLRHLPLPILAFFLWIPASIAQESDTITWIDATSLKISGQGWNNLQHPFDRLPAHAQPKVREPVWNLAQNSAGISITFRTDATSVKIRWALRFDTEMNHMAYTGIKGVDLYVKNNGKWLWAAVGRPDSTINESTLIENLPSTDRDYLLYLPLYDGVDSVSIGIPSESKIERLDPWTKKPLVFYGTSITQGGCASRPGMAYPAIIGRMLDRETINLGFSGNGRMEMELAETLAELDAEAYVIDCLPNMTPELVKERVVPFVQYLKEKRPNTVVILVESITYENAWINDSRGKVVQEKNQNLREAFMQLKDGGMNELFLLPSEGIIGDDHEATVDGAHFTDLGFLRYAERFVEFWEGI